MRSLTKTLKEDWPECFARCTEDADGCIQVCFHQGKIVGDVTTYMNHFFRTNIDVQQYALRKDPTRWGVVIGRGAGGGGGFDGAGGGGGGDGGGDAGAGAAKAILRFFFIPMWVHVRGSVDLGVSMPSGNTKRGGLGSIGEGSASSSASKWTPVGRAATLRNTFDPFA